MPPSTKLANAIRDIENNLTFTIIEIGAVPLSNRKEPFHDLLNAFPGSQLIAFELDKQLCADLNRKSPRGMRYFAVALGRTEETRPLYETVHPMCTSLYRPNEPLLDCYNNLHVAKLKSISSVETVSLDRFTADHEIRDVDFIKIDIQGAELEVFQGGGRALRDLVALVTEVEFVPLYVDQPLFGDVCRFLSDQGLMFHKFIGLAGRTLRPTIANNDPNFAIQHLWADAMFVRNVTTLTDLSPRKLLKLAVMSYLYESSDLTVHCLRLYDQQCGTQVLERLLAQ
jgi:FkbM family methyltransferase